MKFKVVLPILGFEDIKEFEVEEVSENFYINIVGFSLFERY